ncbi:MAG: hypothetical protein KGZ39_06135 [Simkania sp.]|nr:hypothetical protein [Simkania sp.]
MLFGESLQLVQCYPFFPTNPICQKRNASRETPVIEAAAKKPRKNEDGTAGKSEQDPEAD